MNQDPQMTAVWLWVHTLTTAVPMALSGVAAIYVTTMVLESSQADEIYATLMIAALLGLPAIGDLGCLAATAWVGWLAWNGDVRLVRPCALAVIVLGLVIGFTSLLTFSCCALLLRPPGLLAAVVALLTCPRDLDRSFGAAA